MLTPTQQRAKGMRSMRTESGTDRFRRVFPVHDGAALLRLAYPDAPPAFLVPPATCALDTDRRI